jgi:uncharacterized membrane protein YqjE
MVQAHPDQARAAEGPGLIANFSALLAAKLGYLRARLMLAGIEGKEAAIHAAILLGLAVGGLVALVFGYFLLVLGLVFLIALAFDNENAWIWVLLGAAAMHFAGAVALVFIAKAKLSTPLFPLTLDELQKDQAWLRTTKKPN